MKVAFGSSSELQVNLIELWKNEALLLCEPAGFLLNLECVAENWTNSQITRNSQYLKHADG